MTELFKSLPLGNTKKAEYGWQSDKTKMLRMLRNSKTLKEKHKWSRATGAGFIASEIMKIELLDNKSLIFDFGWRSQLVKVGELSLRETEEAIKFLEGKKP